MQGLKEEEKLVKQLLQGIEKDLRIDGDAITAFREVRLCAWKPCSSSTLPKATKDRVP